MIALVAPGALAETGPGRLRLPTGSVMVGVITELEVGDHVTLLLPSGASRSYEWSSIEWVQVHGHAARGPSAPKLDLRPWPLRIAPASVVPSLPAEAPEATPTATPGAWALGARGTLSSATGASRAGVGFGGEGSLTHWLSPDFGVYAMFEHTRFPPSVLGARPRTSMFGAGVRVASSHRSVAALLDVASGYRVLSTDGEDWSRRGAIPLRLGAGIRLRPTQTTDFDLLVHLAPHLVTYDRGPSRCNAAACGPPTPGPLGFVGISLGMGLGL